MPRRPASRKGSKHPSRYASNLRSTDSSAPTTSHYFSSSSSTSQARNVRERVLPSILEDGLSRYGPPVRDHSLTPSISSTAINQLPKASGHRSRASNLHLGMIEPQNIICAVSEARSISPVVGIAFINTSLGEVILSQICDTQTYVKTTHKINVMEASKVVFMSTVCPPHASCTLFSAVEENVHGALPEKFDRSAWSEKDGLEYIEQFAFEEDVEPLKVALEKKYYAIASFSAAVKYMENYLGVRFTQNSLRIQYRPSDDTMMIDIDVFKSLEIMQNMHNPRSKDCLFGLLNNTLTPMGARMLRTSILEPSTQEVLIETRYDAVEELASQVIMQRETRKALKGIRDIEKILSKIVVVPLDHNIVSIQNQVNQVLSIKSFVMAIPTITQALGPAQSSLLVTARASCQDEAALHILDLIQKVIVPDATYVTSPLDLRNQRTFAVKSGINIDLDIRRQVYKTLSQGVSEYLDELNERHRVGAILKYDNGRMYWLQIKAANLEDGTLPSIFINAIRKKQYFECQTLDLVKMNRRISEASNEVMMQSDSVIWDLVGQLRSHAAHLYQMAESIAMVDMISAFAQAAAMYNYIRPEITPTLALKNARHPILDKNNSTSYVPNDYFSDPRRCFNIITGCNMSGKSTYIRSIALLQIMAQIGSLVPAEYASFSVVHTLFARVILDDRMEANLSTFSVEMRDMAFILKNIDNRSMAIIDELGRGTATRDGLAIAVAMSEALVKTGASVWFATHFIELAKALESKMGVLNLHLSARHTTTADGLPHITMLYKTEEGVMKDESHYGINMARAIGLPKSFCDMAEEVASSIRQKREDEACKSKSRISIAKRDLIKDLHDQLTIARESGVREALPGFLQNLQARFIADMAKLEEE